MKAILLLLCLLLCGCSSTPQSKEDVELNQESVVKKEVELIPNDKYEEPLHSYSEMNEAYNDLTSAIESQDPMQEAVEVARSFAFDFFTLANKESNEDVGGIQFIPSVNIHHYQEYAKSYYYSNYGVIVNEYGKESLPKVIDVKLIQAEPAQYTYFDSPCEGYDVTLELTYEKSKLPESMLKKSMVISMMNITDFDFSRSYDYQDPNTVFEGEMKDCWRVLALK